MHQFKTLLVTLVVLGSLPSCTHVAEHCAGGPCAADGGSGDESDDESANESMWLSVTKTGAGEGDILIDGELCMENPCELRVARGTSVSLRASPSIPSTFIGWSNGCERDRVCDVIVDEDLRLEVAFEVSGELEAQVGLAGVAGPSEHAVDANGNVYALGEFTRALPFETVEGSTYRRRGYLAKYSPDGAPIWVHRFDFDNQSFNMYALTLGPNEEIYVAGHAHKHDPNISEDRYQGFIARIDPDTGSELWRHVDHSIGSWGIYLHLRVDPMGRLFVGGMLGRGKRLNLGGVSLRAGADDQTAFVATLNDAGGVTSAMLVDSPYPGHMIANPTGGVTLSASGTDGQSVLLEFGHDGSLQSSTPTGGYGHLARSHDGNLVIAGYHDGAVSWGNTEDLELEDPEGSRSNIFLATVRPDGTALWARSIGGSTEEVLKDAVVGIDGNVFFSGIVRYSGTVDLGGGQLPRYGSQDGFLASYTEDGEHRWSRTVGSPQNTVDMSHLDVRADTLRAFGGHYYPLPTEVGLLELSGHPDTEQRGAAPPKPTMFYFEISR